MGKIVLARIDDRLIHGQVMTAWVKHTRGNQILIVDNEVANDAFMAELLKMSAPTGIDIQVKTVVEAVSFIKEIPETDKQVIVLVKGPQVIAELIEKGCLFEELIVGGMGANESRTVVYKNISASMIEREIFKRMISEGLSIKIHVIPDQKAVDLEKYL